MSASKGTRSSVHALCVLPDGRLASGSGDETIRLWDVQTGAESARLEEPSGLVRALCVLLNRLWDHHDRRRERPPRRALRSRQSAVCAAGRPARLGLRGQHNPAVGRARPVPRAPASKAPGPVMALCVLPDGRLASGSGDNTIRLWDVKTGAESARLEGHSGLVRALCLLPDGRLASGSDYDNTIRLWDVKSRRRERPPRRALGSGHGAVPAAGRAARLGLMGQHDPAVGRENRRRERPP